MEERGWGDELEIHGTITDTRVFLPKLIRLNQSKPSWYVIEDSLDQNCHCVGVAWELCNSKESFIFNKHFFKIIMHASYFTLNLHFLWSTYVQQTPNGERCVRDTPNFWEFSKKVEK